MISPRAARGRSPASAPPSRRATVVVRYPAVDNSHQDDQVFNSNAVTLCLPGCDPLTQDCASGQTCVPGSNPLSFVCLPDASDSEGQAFDPCEHPNACDPGLLCLDPALGDECDALAIGCCLPYCDLTAWECPGVGQICLPWYEEGSSPEGLADVGICGQPQ